MLFFMGRHKGLQIFGFSFRTLWFLLWLELVCLFNAV